MLTSCDMESNTLRKKPIPAVCTSVSPDTRIYSFSSALNSHLLDLQVLRSQKLPYRGFYMYVDTAESAIATEKCHLIQLVAVTLNLSCTTENDGLTVPFSAWLPCR